MKNTILKHTLFLIISLSIIFSFAITSCGGGGGGGGGGTAAGPAPSSTDDSSSGSGSASAAVPAAPAPVPSALAEITSFSFTQADNDVLNADLNGNPQTVNDVASVQVYYAFNSQQSQDFENLKPVIEISAGASISPEPDATQNFTSDVVYTVTAEDGTTTKEWTVSVQQTSPTQRKIEYDTDEGSINCEAQGVFNVEQGITLPSRANVTKPNCYFAGWMEESNGGQIVSGWGANERQNDVSLKAYWKPAPYIEGHNIYANGIPVYVKNDGGKTMVSFYDDETNEEIKLSDINADAEYQDLTGYTLYAGDSGNTNASGIPPTDGSITMLGGTLSNIYGYNRDGTNLVGNVTIDIRGGTVSTDVVGYNGGTSNQPANTVLNISGNPTIGDKYDNGIWLNSLTSQIVTINGSISSNAEAITLIANHSNISEGTTVATFTSGSADAGKFKLLRDDTHRTVNVNSSGSNIVIIGSFELPDSTRVTWIGEDEFTIGTGNVNSGGTIFSVFADGGFLTVTETTLTGARFDMGIPLDNNNKEDGYDSSLSTSKKYRYIQFTSEAGNITAKNADTFLSKIHFHTISGASVKVRINLETVPITGNGYTLNQDVFYLDGSFYKKSAWFATGGKSWPEAYDEAKAQTFNGLQGYLMTITSDAENKFVYDQIFKAEQEAGKSPDDFGSWIGGTRITPRNGYDASTWGWDKDSLNKSGKATWNLVELNDSWAWACGPEAGKVFYTKAKYGANKNYRAAGMYSSWSNKTDCELNGIEYYYTDDVEPNNGNNDPAKKDAEYYTQYTGRYVWNDGHEKGNGYSGSQKRWQIHYYIVEFTPYEATAYGPGQRATKTALHAEREYNKN